MGRCFQKVVSGNWKERWWNIVTRGEWQNQRHDSEGMGTVRERAATSD